MTLAAGPWGQVSVAEAAPPITIPASAPSVVLDSLPVVPATPAPAAEASVYVVLASDWQGLSGIAPRIGYGGDWTRLWQENIAVIGANPDLIIPGQQLTVSAAGTVTPAPAPAPAPVPAPPLEPAASTSAAASDYAHPCPSCTITQGFTLGSHDGVDLDQVIGAPVFAAASGTVTVAGPRDPTGFGQAVYIDGDDGAVYWYGHIDTWTVTVGQHVDAGVQIATVGNRGQVVRGAGDGSHLHFAVRVGPGAVNPVSWMADRGVAL